MKIIVPIEVGHILSQSLDISGLATAIAGSGNGKMESITVVRINEIAVRQLIEDTIKRDFATKVGPYVKIRFEY